MLWTVILRVIGQTFFPKITCCIDLFVFLMGEEARMHIFFKKNMHQIKTKRSFMRLWYLIISLPWPIKHIELYINLFFKIVKNYLFHLYDFNIAHKLRYISIAYFARQYYLIPSKSYGGQTDMIENTDSVCEI